MDGKQQNTTMKHVLFKKQKQFLKNRQR